MQARLLVHANTVWEVRACAEYKNASYASMHPWRVMRMSSTTTEAPCSIHAQVHACKVSGEFVWQPTDQPQRGLSGLGWLWCLLLCGCFILALRCGLGTLALGLHRMLVAQTVPGAPVGTCRVVSGGDSEVM